MCSILARLHFAFMNLSENKSLEFLIELWRTEGRCLCGVKILPLTQNNFWFEIFPGLRNFSKLFSSSKIFLIFFYIIIKLQIFF